MQRNEDVRRQMISENNKAWSQVAMGPVADLEPPRPQMQGHGASILGMVTGIAGAALGGIGKNQAPPGWTGGPGGSSSFAFDRAGQLQGLNGNLGNPLSSNLKMPTNWSTPQWNTNLNFGTNTFGANFPSYSW